MSGKKQKVPAAVDLARLSKKVSVLRKHLNKAVKTLCGVLREADQAEVGAVTTHATGLVSAREMAESLQMKLSHMSDTLLTYLDRGEEEEDTDGWEEIVEEEDGVLDDEPLGGEETEAGFSIAETNDVYDDKPMDEDSSTLEFNASSSNKESAKPFMAPNFPTPAADAPGRKRNWQDVARQKQAERLAKRQPPVEQQARSGLLHYFPSQ